MSQFYVQPFFNAGHYLALSIWDEDRPPLLYNPQFQWAYRRRGVASNRDQSGYAASWPCARLSAGDITVPVAPVGADICQGGVFEPPSYGESSIQRPYFLRGQCKDSGGAAVPGAVVQGFVTSNDVYVGQCVADSGGFYSLGTFFTSVAHYLVAYLPGSPDIAGTTVNTLMPVTP